MPASGAFKRRNAGLNVLFVYQAAHVSAPNRSSVKYWFKGCFMETGQFLQVPELHVKDGSRVAKS